MFAELTHVARFLSKHPLTCDHKVIAFLRFAQWQFKARLNDEVVVPWIEGTQLAVRRGMKGVTGNIYAGLQDFPDMAFLLHFLRAGDIFCDIGANVGSYTVLASGVCGARTLAFEPDPEAAAALRRNVELNELVDFVTAHEIGLGAYEGEASFTVGLDTENRVTKDGYGQIRKIQVSTLDRIINHEAPILLKIDVEGFNCEVVEGARRVLASKDLKAVIIEWPSQVFDILAELNFDMVAYNAFERKVEECSDKYSQSNYLFIRDHDFVKDRVVHAKDFHVFGQRV
jgi:FkbM family methyltransferase